MVINKMPQEKLDAIMAQSFTGKNPKTFNRFWAKLHADPETAHLATLFVVDGIEKKLIDRDYFLTKYPIQLKPNQMKTFLAWDQNQQELEALTAQNEFLQNKLEILDKSLEETTESRDSFKREYDLLYEHYEEKSSDHSILENEVDQLKNQLAERPEKEDDFIRWIFVGAIGTVVIIFGARFLWRKYVKS